AEAIADRRQCALKKVTYRYTSLEATTPATQAKAMAEKALKQTLFVWEGADKRGARISGEMSASSITMVKADLRRQGIQPLKVKKKPIPLFGGGGKRITPKDIAIFSRQVATMLSSGIPLVQAFDIIGR